VGSSVRRAALYDVRFHGRRRASQRTLLDGTSSLRRRLRHPSADYANILHHVSPRRQHNLRLGGKPSKSRETQITIATATKRYLVILCLANAATVDQASIDVPCPHLMYLNFGA